MPFKPEAAVWVWRAAVLGLLVAIFLEARDAARYADSAASEASSARSMASDASEFAEKALKEAEEARQEARIVRRMLESRFE